jgi:hypothetical protein
MDNKQSMTVADYGGRDQYATCQAREKALNEAILQADISENFERYLELFDAFYADDLEVSSEMQGPTIPLHVATLARHPRIFGRRSTNRQEPHWHS